MITPTLRYQLLMALAAQPTVYVLRLVDLDIDFSTQEVEGLSTLAYINDRPSGAQSKTNPLSGISDIGKISLQLRDQGGFVTETRQNYRMVGQEVELWQGYQPLPFDRYMRIMTGKISAFAVAAQGLSYNLEITDRFDQADFPIFDVTAIAAEPFTGGDKSFDNGSLILRDSDGDEVYDQAILTDNPVNIGLKCWLSGGGDGGDYDVWPGWAGAGLTSEEVDVAWCEAERDKILTVPMRITLTGVVSAKAFVEEEICKALGGYSLLSGEGKIRIHYPSSPVNTGDLELVDDAVLIQKPLPMDSSEYHITHIRYTLGDDGEGHTITLNRASPQYLNGDYPGVERRHEISSRGLQIDLNGVSVAEATMDILFARYGTPPPMVRLQTFFKKHIIESGDTIRIQSQFWTDWDGRGQDAERLLEILSVRAAVDKVEFEAIDLTGALTAGQRAVIAPNGQADWTSATDTEKQYGYIADSATNTFSDGEPAMVWG